MKRSLIKALMMFAGLVLTTSAGADFDFKDSSFRRPLAPEACVSPLEAQLLIEEARIKAETFPSQDFCDDKELSRLLVAMSKLKSLSLDVGELTNPILERIKRPWEFFISGYSSIEYDISSGAYASFQPGSRRLRVTQLLFDLPDIFIQSGLIHEVAHGLKEDKGHIECVGGDVKFTGGACDMMFSSKLKTAGAYSYQTWFLWAVSKYADVSDMARATAFEKVKNTIGNRFNFNFEKVYFNDILVTLNRDNKLLVYDPLLQNLVDYGFDSKLKNEPVVSIEQDPKSLGFVLIGESGKLRGWDGLTDTVDNWKKFSDTSEVGPVRFYTQVFDYDAHATRFTLVSRKGEVWTEQTLENGFRKMKKFERLNAYAGQIKSLQTGSGRFLYVLLESGDLKVLNGVGDPIEAKNHEPLSGHKFEKIFNEEQSGEIYALDNNGHVFLVKRKLTYPVTGIENFEGFELVDLGFQAAQNKKLKKYLGSRFYRFLLDEEGRIFTSRYGKFDRKWKGGFNALNIKENGVLSEIKGIQDFTSVSVVSLDYILGKEAVSDKQIKAKADCDLVSVSTEPWLQRAIGVDSKSRLIVHHNNQCLVVFENVESFRVIEKNLKESGARHKELKLELSFLNGFKKTLESFSRKDQGG